MLAITSVGFTTTPNKPWHHWWPGHLFEVAVVLTVLGGIGEFHEIQLANALREKVREQEATISTLEDRIAIDRMGFRERLREYLAEIARELDFDHNARLTVYKHDASAFAVLARYSPNPDYDKRGRPLYPDDQGLIGKAWREGEAFAQDLPNGDEDLDAYHDELRRRGIPLPMETLEGLNMRARCLAGFSLRDPKGIDPIAVIVFESKAARGLQLALLRRLLDGQRGLRLREYLNDNRAEVPTPTTALAKSL